MNEIRVRAEMKVPPNFREQPTVVWRTRAFVSLDGGLMVLASVDYIDGKRWIHLSASRRSRCPSYEDLAMVKLVFLGPDVTAYQVFPAKSEHRNFMDYCLHLWSPLDGDPFPDFSGERARTVAP